MTGRLVEAAGTQPGVVFVLEFEHDASYLRAYDHACGCTPTVTATWKPSGPPA